jgi:hypothetical protein
LGSNSRIKGCLNYVLAAILICLLIVTGMGIYTLYFINHHFYLNQPMDIKVPELSSTDTAKLLRLVPVGKLVPGVSEPGLDIKLSADEFNWLANYFLQAHRPDARISMDFEDAWVTVKYSRKLAGNKYLNVIMDAGLAAQNGEFQVSMERLKIGDWFVPATLLGQVNQLAELSLDRGLNIFGIQLLKVDSLRLTADQLEIVFVHR